jgi:alpha-galactosidase/6-phospho-beta-glucosidase family protein
VEDFLFVLVWLVGIAHGWWFGRFQFLRSVHVYRRMLKALGEKEKEGEGEGRGKESND